MPRLCSEGLCKGLLIGRGGYGRLRARWGRDSRLRGNDDTVGRDAEGEGVGSRIRGNDMGRGGIRETGLAPRLRRLAAPTGFRPTPE